MSGRFPGANNLSQFWDNLCNGRESVRFFSEAELLASGIPESLLRNSEYVKASPVLENVDLFDARFFGFSEREARFLDPQQRLLLELSWEALELAGYIPDQVKRTVGVFAGSGGAVTSYLLNCLDQYPEIRGATGSFQHLANDKDFVATRISYKLNLRGPSMAIQSACSTSLVAVHEACQSLIAGECDMALAGAVNIRIPHYSGYLRQDGDVFSEDGHCRPFDAAATGILFGSGGGVVVLKPLDLAIEDQDSVYAVVKGSSVNNDGGPKLSFTSSSVHGQETCISEALAVSGISVDSIGYIEAHGTGTTMGDPIEVAALTRAFQRTSKRKNFCPIASVKGNIGHLDVASGIASLIKTVLCMQNQKIPASINLNVLNPKIDFSNSPFFVNREMRSWVPAGSPLRAGVNSLGMGGTNAFLILEQFNRQAS